MGMDVYGKNPVGPEGEYFYCNVWGWWPLVQLCNDLAPNECAPCENWYENVGDGLEAEEAKNLSVKLRDLMKNGAVAAYLEKRAAALDAMPDVTCTICDGSGIRISKRSWMEQIIDPEKPVQKQTVCNGCHGEGKTRPRCAQYHVEIEDVQEFCAFLEASGGFEIR